MAKKQSLATKLKALQKDWKKAKPKTSGMPVPIDDYVITIAGAVLEEAKKTKRLQINWDLEVAEGDYKGKHVHKYAGCDTAENLDYVQGDLEVLELEIPGNIANIGEVLGEAVGLTVGVTVRKSDEFLNVDFNELLEADEEEEEEEDEEEEEEEDEEEEDEEEEEEEEEDEEEDEGEEEDEEELTEEDIQGMDKKALRKVVKDYDLEIEDMKDLTIKKLRAAVIDELWE